MIAITQNNHCDPFRDVLNARPELLGGPMSLQISGRWDLLLCKSGLCLLVFRDLGISLNINIVVIVSHNGLLMQAM